MDTEYYCLSSLDHAIWRRSRALSCGGPRPGRLSHAWGPWIKGPRVLDVPQQHIRTWQLRWMDFGLELCCGVEMGYSVVCCGSPLIPPALPYQKIALASGRVPNTE